MNLAEVGMKKKIPVYVQLEFNERELMAFYVENLGDLKVLKLSAPYCLLILDPRLETY